MNESMLEDIDEDLKPLYRKNYKTIKTRISRGKLKTIYHFLVTDSYNIKEYLSTVKADQNGKYKLNVALGFILNNIETGELRFFHPSQNSLIFDQPKMLDTEADYKSLLEDLEQEDLINFASSERPSTKWRVTKIVCVRFDTYKL